MLQGVHDGGDAFGEEIGPDHDGEGEGALHRLCQQDDAGANRKNRRNQRPPEARHLPGPERQHQAGNPADQKHPAQENGDGKARKRRHDHCCQPQDHEQDAFDQKGLPMLAYRSAHFRLHPGDVLGKGHGNSPDAGTDDAALWRPNLTFANAADSNLFIERGLATAGRGGKALRRRAHPVATEDIDRRGGYQ